MPIPAVASPNPIPRWRCGAYAAMIEGIGIQTAALQRPAIPMPTKSSGVHGATATMSRPSTVSARPTLSSRVLSKRPAREVIAMTPIRYPPRLAAPSRPATL